MRDSKEVSLIKVGNINPGHNKYDASSVYSIGGVAPTIAARDYKGAKLILSVSEMSIKVVKDNSVTPIRKMDYHPLLQPEHTVIV